MIELAARDVSRLPLQVTARPASASELWFLQRRSPHIQSFGLQDRCGLGAVR